MPAKLNTFTMFAIALAATLMIPQVPASLFVPMAAISIAASVAGIVSVQAMA